MSLQPLPYKIFHVDSHYYYYYYYSFPLPLSLSLFILMQLHVFVFVHVPVYYSFQSMEEGFPMKGNSSVLLVYSFTVLPCTTVRVTLPAEIRGSVYYYYRYRGISILNCRYL